MPTAAVDHLMQPRRSVALQVTLHALMLYATTCFAASVTSTIDGGGGRSASASYTMDGSLGGIAGVSSIGSDTAKHGYIGQLYDVVSVSVTGTPASVNETSTSQLSGMATMDDSTVSALAGSDVAWNAVVYPLASINGNGLATMSAVYQNTSGAFGGSYLGVNGTGQLLVLDSIPDNYGSYAGDGIPDSWQTQYFGLNNPNAVPGIDADGTGQNNLFKYVAGLDPTNPASIFIVKIASVPGLPSWKNLVFSPRWPDRTYTPLFRTSLVSGGWNELTNTNLTDNGVERTVTDLGATETSKFYRIKITYP